LTCHMLRAAVGPAEPCPKSFTIVIARYPAGGSGAVFAHRSPHVLRLLRHLRLTGGRHPSIGLLLPGTPTASIGMMSLARVPVVGVLETGRLPQRVDSLHAMVTGYGPRVRGVPCDHHRAFGLSGLDPARPALKDLSLAASLPTNGPPNGKVRRMPAKVRSQSNIHEICSAGKLADHRLPNSRTGSSPMPSLNKSHQLGCVRTLR
jgi:hypothetical protein